MKSMTHTEKTFLFNVGEENWTDTWLDVIPVEIMQLIYRKIYDDNIQRIYIAHFFHRLTPTPVPHLWNKYIRNGWTSDSSKVNINNQMDICSSHPTPHRQHFTLHNFKMGLSRLANVGAGSLNVTKSYRVFNVDYPELYIYPYDMDEVPFNKDITYDGFKFKLKQIEYSQERKRGEQFFTFKLFYINHSVGLLTFCSKDFDIKESNKNNKTRVHFPDDYSILRFTISDISCLEYYDTFKQL